MGTSAPGAPIRTLRLAELLAAVSLATDLADDAPMESALRDAVTAISLGRLAGLGDEDLRDIYYLALLHHLGCTASAGAQARAGGGDDVGFRRSFGTADLADRPQLLRLAGTRVAREWGPLARAQAVVGVLTAGPDLAVEAVGGMCEVAARLAARLGAGERVSDALSHVAARWDGKVFSRFPSGDSISYPARVVHLVRVARAFYRAGGPEAAADVVTARRNAEFDPQVCDLWLAHSEELLRHDDQQSVWEIALAAEPEPHRRVPGLRPPRRAGRSVPNKCTER